MLSDTKPVLLHNVPVELWRRVKASAAGKGISVTEEVVGVLKSYLEAEPASAPEVRDGVVNRRIEGRAKKSIVRQGVINSHLPPILKIEESDNIPCSAAPTWPGLKMPKLTPDLPASVPAKPGPMTPEEREKRMAAVNRELAKVGKPSVDVQPPAVWPANAISRLKGLTPYTQITGELCLLPLTGNISGPRCRLAKGHEGKCK